MLTNECNRRLDAIDYMPTRVYTQAETERHVAEFRQFARGVKVTVNALGLISPNDYECIERLTAGCIAFIAERGADKLGGWLDD